MEATSRHDSHGLHEVDRDLREKILAFRSFATLKQVAVDGQEILKKGQTLSKRAHEDQQRLQANLDVINKRPITGGYTWRDILTIILWIFGRDTGGRDLNYLN
jgi:hypothetical protein